MVTGIALASKTLVTSRSIAVMCAALVASSCCSSLSKLVDPQYRVAPNVATGFSPSPSKFDVEETSETWHDAARNRDVPVKIYEPAHAHGPLPVVVFSHGIGEDRDSYAYLGRAWASHGFMAVHVTHAGTDKAMLKTGYWHLYEATKKKENWISRPLDVTFVLDQLAKRAGADMSHVAAAGHSAGAFTALAVAGMRTVNGDAFTDPRVKVAIAISMPKMNGVVAPAGYQSIHIPVLHMTGTCDTSLIDRTFPADRRVPFLSGTGVDQYLVTLDGVTHDTFSNAEDPAHPLIAQITTEFLDAYLLGDRDARAWFDRGGLSALRGVAVERKPMR